MVGGEVAPQNPYFGMLYIKTLKRSKKFELRKNSRT